MRAYVMPEAGRLELTTVADPACAADEIVLETEAVSVCSTDVSHFRGHLRPESWPVVPGHEYVGRVVEIGAALTGRVRLGDRLSYWGQTDFGGLAEFRALCPLFPGGPDGSDGANGETRWHTPRNFYDADQAAAVTVPPGLDPGRATLAEPLTSVLRSLLANPPAPGDTVVLLGCGPSALLALQVLLRCMAVGRVVALDRDPARLRLARALGAETVFDVVGQADDLERFLAEHGDSFADYALDALPHIETPEGCRDARQAAMALLRPGGTYVIYGATAVPQPVHTWLILAKGLRVQASAFDVRLFPMWRTAHVARVALGLIERGIVDVAPLLTGHVDFADEPAVRSVFTRYGEGGALKTSIGFGGGPTGAVGMAGAVLAGAG
ncbi:Alcohol dehydrogenase zinc-binding domain protein [Actinobacteria bacterium OK074]|nr:Alcohol dehydrogenase zinc-binding domain protein [Actinobacteria bacterium OK074]